MATAQPSRRGAGGARDRPRTSQRTAAAPPEASPHEPGHPLAEGSGGYRAGSETCRRNRCCGTTFADDTVRAHLVALERLMVVEDQPAWAPHLRSKSVLRSAPKRHFVDPSLAVAALGSSPAGLLADLRLFGFLFESLVVRDLRVYAQAQDATVSHYRDNTGLEVDAVVQRREYVFTRP